MRGVGTNMSNEEANKSQRRLVSNPSGFELGRSRAPELLLLGASLAVSEWIARMLVHSLSYGCRVSYDCER
jgi:hypothetical protein